MAILSLGKNAFAVKMQALVIGGVLGALGGIIYVLPSSVQPDSMGRALTFFAWTALLLGGAATIFGPVLGSILFFVVRIFIKGTADVLVPDSLMNSQQTEQFSWIVVGVALMLLVIFRPQGHPGRQEGVAVQCLRRPPGPPGCDSADPEQRRALMAQVEAAPGSAKPDPILTVDRIVRQLRRHDRRRRGPPRGAAWGDHRADRPQRGRQDHVLQPDHRVRQAHLGPQRRPLVLRRGDPGQDRRRPRSPRPAWCGPSS